ncbi:hypothetical protein MKW92_036220 [Papaver armeniacum]|nr:hypothetical protein MKW92_036220 [Papaver armeniacum]
MRVSMSVYLKSSDAAALPEDIKNWMLRTLGCNDYSYDVCDNDEERLEGLKSGTSNRLDQLQSLGVDTSKYQDSDDGTQYLNFQPTRATIDEYMLLEEEITRRHDDLSQLSEDAHPFDQYLNSVKNNVETLESVVNGRLRKGKAQQDPDGFDQGHMISSTCIPVFPED